MSTTSRLFGRTGTVIVDDIKKKMARPGVLKTIDVVTGISGLGMCLSVVVYNCSASICHERCLIPSPLSLFAFTILLALVDAVMTVVWLLVAATVETQQVEFAMTNLLSVEQACGKIGRVRRRRSRYVKRGPHSVIGDDANSIFSDCTYQDGDDDDCASVCSSCRGVLDGNGYRRDQTVVNGVLGAPMNDEDHKRALSVSASAWSAPYVTGALPTTITTSNNNNNNNKWRNSTSSSSSNHRDGHGVMQYPGLSGHHLSRDVSASALVQPTLLDQNMVHAFPINRSLLNRGSSSGADTGDALSLRGRLRAGTYVDPTVLTKMSAQSSIKSMDESHNINRENIPSNHRREREMRSPTSADVANTLETLAAFKRMNAL